MPADRVSETGRQAELDRLASVYVANTAHEEDQPPHLRLKDPNVPVAVNLASYAGPEERYARPGSTSS